MVCVQTLMHTLVWNIKKGSTVECAGEKTSLENSATKVGANESRKMHAMQAEACTWAGIFFVLTGSVSGVILCEGREVIQ